MALLWSWSSVRCFAVLHALLSLHASLLLGAMAASSFTMTQTRVTVEQEPTWDIERVATVELGGETLLGYRFDCSTSANDGSQLTWTRDSTNNNPFGVGRITGGSRLTAESVDLIYGNLGVYVCEDLLTGASEMLNITNENPAICPDEVYVEAVAAGQVELTVYISTIGGPPMENSVRWTRPNGTIIDGDDPGVQFQTTKRRLILSDLTTAHSGVYKCTAFYQLGGSVSSASTSIELRVFVPSTITHPPSQLTTNEWEAATLSCTATGSAPLTITWKRAAPTPELPLGSVVSDPMAVPNVAESTVTVTSTLTLSSVRYADAGLYYCEAFNSLTLLSNTEMSDNAEIIVIPTLRVEHEDLQNELLFISAGTSLSVKCYGSGSLSWQSSRDIAISTDSSAPVYTVYDYTQSLLTLNIPSFTSELTAIYTCASDLVPGLEHSIFITNVNLAVFISPDILYATTGDTVNITASIHAISPITTVKWYRNGTLLEPESDNRYSASSDSSQALLTIHSFNEEQMGEFMVVVMDNEDRTVSTAVDVLFPDPASATISPSQMVVDIGNRVEVTCLAGGSEALEIVWSLGDGNRLLPDGVVAEGTRLTIATASRSHSNTYLCTVSTTVESSQATATFTLHVRYTPEANILYNSVTASSHVLLFTHGDGAPPTFTCIVDGFPVPSISWQLSGGAPLPQGTEVTEDNQSLSWTHQLQFSDSGVYECVASNVVGESVARVDMTVVYDPIIDTVYPAPGVSSTGDSAVDFYVPLSLLGTAITCSAFAWPPPTVEWSKSSGVLPSGVESSTTTNGGIVVSELVFSERFSASNIGVYRCEVRSSEDVEEKTVSQLVELYQGSSSASTQQKGCQKVSSDSIIFQLRVSTSQCNSWTSTQQSEIAREFESLLFRVVSTQCEECGVTQDHVTVVTLRCSDYIDGGVVFRGMLQTDSAARTEQVFCVLSRWQESGSLVSIDDYRYAVDSQCSLHLDSYDTPECTEDETTSLDMNMIILIAVPSGGVFLICVIVVLVSMCSLCWCRCCRKQKISDEERHVTNNQASLVSFTRTDSHSHFREPQNSAAYESGQSVGSMNRQQVNPFYGDSGQFGDANTGSQSASPDHRMPVSLDHRPLMYRQNSSAPKERETTFTVAAGGSSAARGASNILPGAPPGSDSPPHAPRQTNVSTNVQPYQIATASSTSLSRIGVSNPMWLVDEGNRGERRLSEGPPNRTPPRPHPITPSVPSMYRSSQASPPNQLPTTRSQNLADHSSTEKIPLSSMSSEQLPGYSHLHEQLPGYSHLNFGGRTSVGSGRGGPPVGREWYDSGSEISMASGRRMNSYISEGSMIQPYATVRNSQIPQSSLRPITAPALPPPNPTRQATGFNKSHGDFTDGQLNNDQFSQGPPHIQSDGIPSLTRMQGRGHFETIVV